MDVHTQQQRSYNMSRIKPKGTKPEETVRRWLCDNGYRYRLHRKDIPGKPDFVFTGRKKVIFVHGCFWHKHDCKFFHWPATNPDFWQNKIENNFLRDQKNYKALTESGWKYLIIWECELKDKSQSKLWRRVKKYLG